MGDIAYMFMYVQMHGVYIFVCVPENNLGCHSALLFEKGSLSLGPTACPLDCTDLLPSRICPAVEFQAPGYHICFLIFTCGFWGMKSGLSACLSSALLNELFSPVLSS